MIKVQVKSTGEVIEFDVSTSPAIVESWRLASEYIKAYEKAKEQMKKLIPALVDERGTYEHDGYMFRVSNIQRKNYDKTVLRQNLDADTFDLLLKPDKSAVDKFLKENLEDLGEVSSIIRNAMVDEGRAYQVIKLEKLDR